MPESNPNDLVPLPQVASELRMGGHVNGPVPYGQIWRGAASGEFPVEPIGGNKVGVRRRDLPLVAKALRLVPEPVAA